MKIIIVYGTKRGVTGRMAEKAAAYLRSNGREVDCYNVYGMPATKLLEYDVLLLASSTWSDGDLQSDFIEFEREMDELDLSGKKASVFGSGNSRYRFFCEAVGILESRIRSCNGTIVCPVLKADELSGKPEDQMDEWLVKLNKSLD